MEVGHRIGLDISCLEIKEPLHMESVFPSDEAVLKANIRKDRILKTVRVSCPCRKVQLEVTGDPKYQMTCHCSDCRAWTGAPAATLNLFPPEQVEVLSGSLFEYRKGIFSKTVRKCCLHCHSRILTDRTESIGLLDISGSILGIEHEHTAHLHYSERIMSVTDDLHKFQDKPKQLGGTGSYSHGEVFKDTDIKIYPMAGACYCERTKVVIKADPIMQACCHCSDCRHWSGTFASGAWIFDKQHVEVHGQLLSYQSNGRSKVIRKCCEHCFGPVLVERPEIGKLEVAAGLFQTEFKPHCHTHYGERILEIHDDLPRYKDWPSHCGGSHSMLEDSRRKTRPQTFDAEIERHASGWGIELDLTDSFVCVVKSIRPGSIADWNTTCPADKLVKVGYRLLAVDGKRGHPELLAHKLQVAQKPALTFARPEYRTVKVANTREPLGLNLHIDDQAFGLVVYDINDGMVKKSKAEIYPNDRIISVNGVEAKPSMLLKFLRQSSCDEFQMTIASY